MLIAFGFEVKQSSNKESYSPQTKGKVRGLASMAFGLGGLPYLIQSTLPNPVEATLILTKSS